MKTIHFVRHAKSSWKYHGVEDLDRPLKGSGIKDAHKIALGLAAKQKASQLKIDAIVSSDAIRALHTAVILSRHLREGQTDVLVEPVVYSGKSKNILQEVIHSLSPAFREVIIVGHDPELTASVNQLSGRTLDKIPTSGIVTLRFPVEQWTRIKLKKSKK